MPAPFFSIPAVAIRMVNGGSLAASIWDPVFFGVIGFLISRGWRSAAVIGAVLLGLGLVGSLVQGILPGVTAPFIFVGLLSGVRGTFAAARLRRELPHAAASSTT